MNNYHNILRANYDRIFRFVLILMERPPINDACNALLTVLRSPQGRVKDQGYRRVGSSSTLPICVMISFVDNKENEV